MIVLIQVVQVDGKVDVVPHAVVFLDMLDEPSVLENTIINFSV